MMRGLWNKYHHSRKEGLEILQQGGLKKVNCSFHSTFETKLNNIKDYDVMIYILNLYGCLVRLELLCEEEMFESEIWLEIMGNLTRKF